MCKQLVDNKQDEYILIITKPFEFTLFKQLVLFNKVYASTVYIIH